MSTRLHASFAKNKFNTRAQVTTFIVVGLVLLGVVGILFSISNSFKTESITTAKSSQDDRARFDAAVKILRDCITTSSQQAIVTIAQQGGSLFDDQGGPDSSGNAVPTVVDQTKTVFVAKGISRRTDELGFPTQIQFAPGLVRSAPIDPTQNQDVRTLGGSVTLPKLCDRFGPNNPANADVILTCEISSYGYDGQTIQNKLASAIQKQTIACAQNSQLLLSQLGDDVSTYFGSVPQVIFGDSDITVDYSFDTNVSIRQSNFSHYETTIRVPARYKRLYNFVYAVLNQDSKNILFDKTSDYTQVNTCNYPGSSACWSDGFSLSVTYGAFVDYTTGRLYDLVVASDNRSLIGGKPLEFRTMVENRRPVLVPMYDVLSFPSATTHPESDWQRRYDIYVHNGNTVLLRPFAYDFDEEASMAYTYSGWKATTDSSYRTGTFTTPDEGCDDFDPLRCRYWDDSYMDELSAPTQNLWQASPTSSFITGAGCDGATGRCASYKTDADGADIGPHSVRVTAVDRAGLSDYLLAAVIVGTD